MHPYLTPYFSDMSSTSSQHEAADGQEGPLTSAAAATAAAVTLTKSGNVSKMRAHRGNVPTLPQTKLCHLCPAKFTRTTHLNRHLKTRECAQIAISLSSILNAISDTNERLHECDVSLSDQLSINVLTAGVSVATPSSLGVIS